MNQIDHIVQVMFENRSLDNLLGYLYAPGDLPRNNFPPANPTTFDGLAFGGPHFNVSSGGTRFDAEQPTAEFDGHSPNVVPWPGPGEPFKEVNEQLYNGGASVTMGGFVNNYMKQGGVHAGNTRQIMQSYEPRTQLPVLATLARSFAVSDAWYCSMPTQTWPNRGFAHAGSSDGHVKNAPHIPWGIDTIFTTLEERNISWGVFNHTLYTPALTQIQFRRHWSFRMDRGFRGFDEFLRRCNAHAKAPASMKLPAYSFVEPRFLAERMFLAVHHGEDYHPPHNVQHAERFLASVYNAVKTSPYRDRILLIITFDEHGGTYDHVVPPSGAQPPFPEPVAKNGFRYDLFGVRVPAIVVSSWVQPGTVFRSNTGVPYDHTSVLATLRDWQGIPQDEFLPSPRIAAAPTLDALLTESARDEPWPDVVPRWDAEAPEALSAMEAAGAPEEDEQLLTLPPDDLEESIVAASQYFVQYREAPGDLEALPEDAVMAMAPELIIPTRRDAMEEMRRMMLGG